MGKQIIGIDLEKIAEYRERVEVGVSKDRTVLLPLIKLKDAHIAEIFLSRLDAIRTEWAIAIASYKNKAGMYANLKLKVEGEEEASGTAPEMSADEYYEAFKQVTVAIEESQKHQASLIKRVRAITEEIHEFLAPYLEGLGVIEVLQEADDAMTQKVLYAMLYGTAAFTEEGEYASKEGDSPKDVKKKLTTLPERLDLSYVLTKIMMAFPSYDLEKLLHTSYKRVLQLFSLADKSSTMRKLEYSIGGAALHDTKIGQILQQVELTATVTDKTAMKSVMTDEAKIKAAEAIRRMSEAKQNEG